MYVLCCLQFSDHSPLGCLLFVYPCTTGNGQTFFDHGAVMFTDTTTHNEDVFAFKLVLFGGGDKDLTFRQGITELNVTIDTKLNTMRLSDIDLSNFEEYIGVSEKLVESKDDTMAKSKLNNDQCYDFGYESITNGKTNEKIIIIIGGKNNSSNVIVWNYTKDEFTFLYNILPVSCDSSPATATHNNHIHCLAAHLHFFLSIDVLVHDFAPFAADGSSSGTHFMNDNKISDLNPGVAMSEISSKVSDVDAPFYLNNPLICIVGIGQYLGLFPDLPSVKIDCRNIVTTFYTKWNYSIILKNSRNKTIYLSKDMEMEGTLNQDDQNDDECKNGALNKAIENGFKLSWTSDEINIFAEEVKYCLINNNHNGLIFVLSSHGGADGIIYACIDDKEEEDDDGEYGLPFLYNIFYPQHDKDGTIRNPREAVLCQIPKIFFVDACRGDMRAKAVINKQKNDNSQVDKNKIETIENKTQSKDTKNVIESQTPAQMQITVTDTDAKKQNTGDMNGKLETKGGITKSKFKHSNKNQNEDFAPLHKEANTCKIYANAEGYAVQGGIEKGGMLTRSVNKVFKDVKFVSKHSWSIILQKIGKFTQQEATMVNNLFNQTQLVSTEMNFQKDIVFAQYRYNEPDVKNNQWQLKMNLFMQEQYFDKNTSNLVIENKSLDNDTISVWVEFDIDNRDRDRLFESILDGSHSKEQFKKIEPGNQGEFDKISSIAYITAINETKNTIICDRFETTLEKLYFFKDNLSRLTAKCNKQHNLLPKILQEDDDAYDQSFAFQQIEQSKENKENKENPHNSIVKKACVDCKNNIEDVADFDDMYFHCYQCLKDYCVGCCEKRVKQAMSSYERKDENMGDTQISVRDPCVIAIGIGDFEENTGIFHSKYSILADYRNIIQLFGCQYGYSIFFKTKSNKTLHLSKIVERDIDKFGFKLKWSEKEILSFVEESKQILTSNKHDSMIFIISSHGGEKDYVLLDSTNGLKRFSLLSIINSYKNTNDGCSYLAGKPKLFIFNANQGNKELYSKESSNSDKVNSQYLDNENCCLIYANIASYPIIDGGKNGSYLVNTSRNYCAMFAHKRLCANICNLTSISVNIASGKYLTCSRDSPMVDEYNHIIFGLIG